MQLPHKNLYTKSECNSLGITSLKRNREDRQFVDLRIILILHCGNECLKQVLNFYFKLDDNVPRYDNHDSEFNDFNIPCWDNNGFRLLIKASILVSRDSPVLRARLHETRSELKPVWDFTSG